MDSEKDVNRRTNNFAGSDDPTFLAARGSFEYKEDAKEAVKHLAEAIYTVQQKHGTAKVRCVGAASVNNGIKASIIAITEARKKGIELVVVPSFTTVKFNDTEERTAILLQIVPIEIPVKEV